MSPDRRRLVALAAALAPARGPALLGWLGGPEGPLAATRAGSLAGASRRVRLAALAAALAGAPEPALPPGRRYHPLLDRLQREAACEEDQHAAPLLGPDRSPTSRPAWWPDSRRGRFAPRSAAQTLERGAAGPEPRACPDPP
jgi:hypothetical protein